MTFFKCGVSSYVFYRRQNCSLTILPARWSKCMIYPALSCFVFLDYIDLVSWTDSTDTSVHYLSEWYFRSRIWVSLTNATFWNSKTASKARLLRSLTLLFVLTRTETSDSEMYRLLENDGAPWMANVIEYFVHLQMTPFETWEISNYWTLVPRNRPLSILQMNMLSLNNFLNKDGAAHYEIFTTQFSCSTRLWKDP